MSEPPLEEAVLDYVREHDFVTFAALHKHFAGDAREETEIALPGNRVVWADLLYTTNGGQKYEEWYRTPAKLVAGNTASAVLPEGTTHYLFNLVDEHQFLISYPGMGSMSDYKGGNYSTRAFAVKAHGNH